MNEEPSLKYVVMTDYGPDEGLKIQGETDDFQEAVKLWRAAMGHTTRVYIFKLVKLSITEIADK